MYIERAVNIDKKLFHHQCSCQREWRDGSFGNCACQASLMYPRVSKSPESGTGTHGGRLRRRHVAGLLQPGSCRLFAARRLSRRLGAFDARSRRLALRLQGCSVDSDVTRINGTGTGN